MFEDFSVPFEFSADWLPAFTGKRMRMHFDPRQPKCSAKLVLLENHDGHKAGEILGDAQLLGETSGHIRFIMGYGIDDQREGYLARQRTAGFVRRETRGIGLGGRVEYSKSEERDGISQVTTIERKAEGGPQKAEAPETARVRPRGHEEMDINLAGRLARMRERQNQ